jgi:hypothetical protein
MDPSNPSHSSVKHTVLSEHQAAASLATVSNIVRSASQCAAVQGSLVAKAALDDLQAAAGTGQTALADKLEAIQTHQTATKTLTLAFDGLSDALRTFEAAVNGLAAGNGATISEAGLLTRGDKVPHAPLGMVTDVHAKPGKLPAEAIVSWPEIPGATSYAIQVNFTPATPEGPWTALNAGTGRRRVITAPAAEAQFLVRVAAQRSDGTQSPWSNAILVTAR